MKSLLYSVSPSWSRIFTHPSASNASETVFLLLLAWKKSLRRRINGYVVTSILCPRISGGKGGGEGGCYQNCWVSLLPPFHFLPHTDCQIFNDEVTVYSLPQLFPGWLTAEFYRCSKSTIERTYLISLLKIPQVRKYKENFWRPWCCWRPYTVVNTPSAKVVYHRSLLAAPDVPVVSWMLFFLASTSREFLLWRSFCC